MTSQSRFRSLLLVAAAAAILAVLGCGGHSSSSTSSSMSPDPGPPMPQFQHVVVVVEENAAFDDVTGSSNMPYLNSLASQYGLATQYFANTHGSIGNYFMMTTGQIITNDPNFIGPILDDNLVRHLTAAGKSWKLYAEDLPSAGYLGGDVDMYLKRHNPFSYLSDLTQNPAQAANMVPFTQFASDLAAGSLPSFSFIVPNAIDDGHQCPGNPNCANASRFTAADAWLKAHIAPLIADANFQQNGLLVITYDESDDSDAQNGGGHVATLVISGRGKKNFKSTTFYQHQSLLRMVEEALGLASFPGAAASAPRMTE